MDAFLKEMKENNGEDDDDKRRERIEFDDEFDEFDEEDDEDDESEEDRKVKYKERTEIDFEGLDVNGELVKPAGALLLDRKRASFNPLIRLRLDFNQEMAESVDEIK